MPDFDHDVIIIGAGPAGIAVATGLLRAGISDILVLEREADIGGIPRHTHHPSFGLLVFKRPVSGPAYIKKLLRRCGAVVFQTKTTVTAIHKDGALDISTPTGPKTLRSRHIVLATGARETPRHARLIPGLRPQGVLSTAALQQFIYTQNLKPFSRAVIVGTELVSFSALWTMRRAGIKPLAMIEAGPRIKAYRPASLFARLLGVPIYYNSTVVDIADRESLTAVKIKNAGAKTRTIACDGLVFSGEFTGDNTLARSSHLAIHPVTQIPLMDQNWNTSERNISVAGNAVHPADMGDQCYLEGLSIGQHIAANLKQTKNKMQGIAIIHGPEIKMTTPNMLRLGDKPLSFSLNLHVSKAYNGPITLKYASKVIYQKHHKCLPTRRITLKNIRIPKPQNTGSEQIPEQIELLLGA